MIKKADNTTLPYYYCRECSQTLPNRKSASTALHYGLGDEPKELSSKENTSEVTTLWCHTNLFIITIIIIIITHSPFVPPTKKQRDSCGPRDIFTLPPLFHDSKSSAASSPLTAAFARLAKSLFRCTSTQTKVHNITKD